MANPVYEVLLKEERLEAPKDNVAATASLEAGAFVDFWGVVRGLENGQEIEGIEYEAHRAMAKHQCELITQQGIEKFGLGRVLIHHRIGFVPAGESSLFVRVASRHRGKAFEGSQWIVDELKQRAPIWKRPKFKIDHQPAEKELVARPSNPPVSAT